MTRKELLKKMAKIGCDTKDDYTPSDLQAAQNGVAEAAKQINKLN